MSFNPSTASLKELREMMGEVIRNNPNSGKFWDLITCLRGPDSPSETPAMSPSESSSAYNQRRVRKAKTVEVIRAMAFFGAVGGAARYRTDREYVELPPRSTWDHFDKHVERAARAIGIEVRIKGEEKKSWEVKCEPVKAAPAPPAIKFGSLAYFKNQLETKKNVLKVKEGLPKSSYILSTIQNYKNSIAELEKKIAKMEKVEMKEKFWSNQHTLHPMVTGISVFDEQAPLNLSIEKGSTDDDIPF